MIFHVEVDFSSFPFITCLGEDGADEAQEGSLVGKEAGDACAAFEFFVDAFERVAGAQAALVAPGEGEGGKALGEVFLHPGGEFGGGGGVGGNDFFEAGLGGELIRAIEDGADGVGDGGALVQTRHISLGVLLEMELAALPGDTREHGLAGGAEAFVVIADDQRGGMEAALLEAGEKGAPMDFSFAQGGADAQDGAFAIGADTQGDEHGAIEDLAALTDLFITGVNENVATGFQGAGAPAFQFGIEPGGALADLGGTNGLAAELFDDGRDLAGGNALDVHFGQGQFEGLFTADALLEGGGIEVQIAADLRDLELNGAAAGDEGFGFKTVGVAQAGVGALIGLGLEGLRTLLAHGFIDQQADALGEAAGAFFIEELQNGVQKFRIALVGHFGVDVGCVCDTPTGNQFGPPSTSFSRAGALAPRWGSAALGSLRSPSLRLAPTGGKGGGRQSNLQK